MSITALMQGFTRCRNHPRDRDQRQGLRRLNGYSILRFAYRKHPRTQNSSQDSCFVLRQINRKELEFLQFTCLQELDKVVSENPLAFVSRAVRILL